MQRHLINGLGDFPPTNGQCWLPGTGTTPGRWTPAEALATCTYPPPQMAAVGSWWARIPTWAKLLGGAVLAIGGYTAFAVSRR